MLWKKSITAKDLPSNYLRYIVRLNIGWIREGNRPARDLAKEELKRRENNTNRKVD